MKNFHSAGTLNEKLAIARTFQDERFKDFAIRICAQEFPSEIDIENLRYCKNLVKTRFNDNGPWPNSDDYIQEGKDLLAELEDTEEKKLVNLAINYGSKNEILNAMKKTKNPSIKNFEKNLYTKKMPDPDILIRTGNTKRISNFLIWQIIYTEIFFEKKMWPDFNEKDFLRILKKFKHVRRNFGGINDGIK